MSEAPTMLLLGARGFVGRHVRSAADAAGFSVIGTSRAGGGDELRCDLLEPGSIRPLLESVKPRVVVNMAGSASVGQSFGQRAEVFALNANGVENLLEAVRSGAPDAHVVCVSSGEIYGGLSEGEPPFSEDSPPRPGSPYAASKWEMEQICMRHAQEGLRIAVVRAFNQIGPGQSARFAASSFARQIAAAELAGRGKLDLRVGNLDAARDFLDVRDGARAYPLIAQHALVGTFNICSGAPVKVTTLIEHMQKNTEIRLRLAQDEGLMRPTDAALSYGSAERLRRATGWQPEIPLARTIADLLAWWRRELR